jgi:hypothetical protein
MGTEAQHQLPTTNGIGTNCSHINSLPFLPPFEFVHAFMQDGFLGFKKKLS